MTKARVCLNMIVKDEAHVIRRCLDSLRPLIDHWVILDTGSTDGTQERIREALQGIPGELHERPWRGFGPSRSEAIALARGKGEFLLFIDADDLMEVPAGFVLPALPDDAYELRIRHGQLEHRRVCLVRNALPWRYEGVLHEYLECDAPYRRGGLLEGPVMRIVGGGGRTQASGEGKYARDAELLEQALLETPDNTRYAFYLAQSYRDSDQHEKAIAAYDRRAAMTHGFDQEVYVSLLWAARLAVTLQRSAAEVIDRFLRAWENRPTRVEAVGELLRYLRENGGRWQLAHALAVQAKDLPPSRDELFVEPEFHEWKLLDEYAVAAYWTAHYEDCRRACERLLGGGALPQSQRERILANLNFARGQLGLPTLPA